jgi:hypothetical protein
MELIQNQDYRIKGYHKEKVYDNKGDVTQVNFYKNYNPVTESYTELKVRESRTVDRDVTTGVPNKVTVDIEWFKSDGVTKSAEKRLEKYINGFDGQQMNQEARLNLTTKAQGYLLQAVGLENTKELGTDVAVERSAYISGTTQGLIDAVNNSARAYMTPEVKATVVTILNVTF